MTGSSVANVSCADETRFRNSNECCNTNIQLLALRHRERQAAHSLRSLCRAHRPRASNPSLWAARVQRRIRFEICLRRGRDSLRCSPAKPAALLETSSSRAARRGRWGFVHPSRGTARCEPSGMRLAARRGSRSVARVRIPRSGGAGSAPDSIRDLFAEREGFEPSVGF